MTHVMVFKTHLSNISSKVAIFGSVLKTFAENRTDAHIDSIDVKPLNEGEDTLTLVTISYTWNNPYPVPDRFELYFGSSENAEYRRLSYMERMKSWGK